MTATNISSSYQPFKLGIIWTVQILKVAGPKLITRILQYRGDRDLFEEQGNILDNISVLVINGITTTGMTAAWDKEKWKAGSQVPSKQKAPFDRMGHHATSLPPEPPPPPQPPPESQIVHKIDDCSVRVRLEDLGYGEGYVYFKYRVGGFVSSAEIRVENPIIRPAFKDLTKYLAKALGTNEATFEIGIEKQITVGGFTRSATLKSARSQEIERIDETLLQQANSAYCLHTIFKGGPDQAPLAAVDSIRPPLGTALPPEKILEKALQTRDTKHSQQLQYLSARHQEDLVSLRYSPDPVAFLFLLEAPAKYFFVLEAYDQTLATYVWECEKSPSAVQAKLKELETLMAAFQDGNRLNYRRSRPAGFYLIEHDYRDEAEGFVKWRKEMAAVCRQ